MGIVLQNCIKMDNGLLLCWDGEDNCGYVIDPKKVKANERNVPAKEWIKLITTINGRIDNAQ